MRQQIRMTGTIPSPNVSKRKLGVLVSVALLALLALAGTASAASLSERIKPEPGVLIVAVGEETPASEAGLARGDILLAIDGDMVNTAAELQHVILMRDPGDTLELTVKRGDEEMTLSATLADRDGYPLLGVAPDAPRIQGLRAQRGRAPAMPGFERSPNFERFRGMERFPIFVGDGAEVTAVLDESPAASAGLMAGDLITAVDDNEITGMRDLAEAVAAYSPGDVVELTVDREGESTNLSLTLGTHPDDGEKAFIGVSIAPAERFRGDMNWPDQGRRQPWGNRFGYAMPFGGRFGNGFPFTELPDGALVMSVQDQGPAALAELQQGDAITAVGDTEISNYQDLVEALAAHSPGDEVELTVMRDGESISTTVSLGAHPDDEDKAFLGVSIMPLERLRMQMKELHDQDQEEQKNAHESQSSS